MNEYARTPLDFPTARALARSAYQDYLEHIAFCPHGCGRDPVLYGRYTQAENLMNELRPPEARQARQQTAAVG